MNLAFLARRIVVAIVLIASPTVYSHEFDCSSLLDGKANVVVFDTAPLFTLAEEVELIAEMDQLHYNSGALNKPETTMTDVTFEWDGKVLNIPGISSKFTSKIESFLISLESQVSSEFKKEGVNLRLGQTHLRSDSLGSWMHNHQDFPNPAYVFFTKSESDAGTIYLDDEGVEHQTSRGRTLLMSDYVRSQEISGAKSLPHGPAHGRRLVIIGIFKKVDR
jgi:hypothetical protein